MTNRNPTMTHSHLMVTQSVISRGS